MHMRDRIACFCIAVSCAIVYGSLLATVSMSAQDELHQAVDTISAGTLQQEIEKARQGDSAAQLGLAFAYGFGKGIKPDLPQAVYWVTKAAEGGSAEAQFYLGSFYYNGFADAVPVDNSKAYFWFSLAARAGYVQAYALRREAGASLSPARLDAINEDISVWRVKVQ